jgi:Bacterial transglutaminase-like cysteine proteinase BTLCP
MLRYAYSARPDQHTGLQSPGAALIIRLIDLLMCPSAITMRNGDCKSYSIAKYAAVRVAGISPDHIRLMIVHNKRHNEDHMVAAVYQGEEWLILDNLTNLLLRDSEKRDYLVTSAAFILLGLTSNPMRAALGTSSRNSPICFGPSSAN